MAYAESGPHFTWFMFAQYGLYLTLRSYAVVHTLKRSGRDVRQGYSHFQSDKHSRTMIKEDLCIANHIFKKCTQADPSSAIWT